MPPTLAEIEEALTHLAAVPPDERGSAWHSYCDTLLEHRRQLAKPETHRRETRVTFTNETR